MSDHDGVEQVITMAWRAQAPTEAAPALDASSSRMGMCEVSADADDHRERQSQA
jgi:hypothetical protein